MMVVVKGDEMKQLHWNVFISLILLAAVFFVANQSLSSVNASTTRVAGIMIDGVDANSVRLHGFGFRPGSLVNLELRPRPGGQAICGTSVWVDAGGAFAAEFDLTRVHEEMTNLDRTGAASENDWMVWATTSTNSFSVPLQTESITQQ